MGPPPAGCGPTFEVRNPADDSLLALVPDMGPQDAKAAIVAAEAAFMARARRSAGERAKILRRWHDLVLARQDDLALLLHHELGKPLGVARGVIGRAEKARGREEGGRKGK